MYMPYSRSYASRRIGRAWRRYRYRKNTSYTNYRQDKKIAALAKKVNKIDEKKWLDQQQITSLSTTWATLLPRDLTFIAQGTGGGSGVPGQRIGNKIKIHSHHLKIVVTGGDSINQYRIMVIRFTAKAASTIDLGDALQSPAVASPFNLMTFKKRDTDSKYQVLWDSKIRTTEGTTTTPTTATQRVHEIVLTNGGKGYFANYNSSSAGGCVQGYTYVVACSDSALPNNPVFTVMSRTVFTG